MISEDKGNCLFNTNYIIRRMDIMERTKEQYCVEIEKLFTKWREKSRSYLEDEKNIFIEMV